jgi:hypothetical protein
MIFIALRLQEMAEGTVRGATVAKQFAQNLKWRVAISGGDHAPWLQADTAKNWIRY